MSDPPHIFLYEDDEQEGPYTLAELVALIEDGQLTGEERCSDYSGEVFYRLFQLVEGDEEIPIPDPGEWPDGIPLMGDTLPHPLDGDDPEDGLSEEPGDDSEITKRRKIYYRGHPSVLAYGWWLIIPIGLIGASAVAGFTTAIGGAWVPWLLCSGIAVIAMMGVERSYNVFLVTGSRVEVLTGIIARNSREVRIVDIRAINVRRTGVLALFGVGTVEFASAGGDDIEVAFPCVYRPGRIKQVVRRIQDGTASGTGD